MSDFPCKARVNTPEFRDNFDGIFRKEPEMTFYQYMLQFAGDNTPVGDVAREMMQDVEENSGLADASPERWKEYIEEVGGCDAALEIIGYMTVNYKEKL